VEAVEVKSAFMNQTGPKSQVDEPEDKLLQARFRRAFGRHAAGVAVVTACADSSLAGTTITSLASVSVDPPMFVFSIADTASSSTTLARAETVVVNLIEAEQADLAALFAKSGVDRFADHTLWDRLDTGEPFLVDSAVVLRGWVQSRQKVGGSTLFIVEVLSISGGIEAEPGLPLVYHSSSWHALSEASKLR
jgi:flavin reductase (DIM6/NTAB) family NADH-FMN oxidoreductase RutF